MAIATINPATGETLKTFEPLSEAALEERLARAAAAWAGYRLTTPEQRAGWLRAAADVLDGDARHGRRADDHRDGQDAGLGEGRGGQVRQGLRYYAEHGPAMPAPTSRPTPTRWARARPTSSLPADRRGAGDHAVELPAVAGDALRRPGAHGGQRRPAQARQQRAADRAVPGGAVRPGRLPGRRVPDAADRLDARSSGCSATTGCAAATLTGSDAGRPVGRRDRRRRAEEDRAGARRQRPVHRHAVGRPRDGRARSPSPRAARTTGRAASPPSASSCTPTSPTSSPGSSPSGWPRCVVGDPMAEDTDVGPLATESGPARTSSGTCRTPSTRARPSSSAASAPDGPGLVLPADPGHRRDAGDGDVHRGGLRPRRRAVPGLGHRRGDRDRQRHPLRARRQRLDRRRGRARARSSATSTPAWCSSTAWSLSYPELPFGGVKQSGYGRELTDLGMYEFMNAKTVWIGAPGSEQRAAHSAGSHAE